MLPLGAAARIASPFVDVDGLILASESIAILERALNESLTPQEAQIIRLRFGFPNGPERTLEEIGAQYNIGKERVRQIEGKALRKLRHPRCSRTILRPFLPEPPAEWRHFEVKGSAIVQPIPHKDSQPVPEVPRNPVWQTPMWDPAEDICVFPTLEETRAYLSSLNTGYAAPSAPSIAAPPDPAIPIQIDPYGRQYKITYPR